MCLKTRIVVAAAGVAAFGSTTAAASLIPFSSARLAAGDGVVATCDPDGVHTAYTSAFDTAVADYRTTAVTVSGIHADCTGRTLSITVRTNTGTVLWQGQAVISATSITFNTTPLRSSAVAGWAMAITG